jgi:manganese oxidase
LDTWESRLSSPDAPFAKYSLSNNTRHFHLTAEPIKHKILSNVTIDAMGYNGSTPGPVIVLKKGEWINLTVENRLDKPTALDVHGFSKPNSQDGAPEYNQVHQRLCREKAIPIDF